MTFQNLPVEPDDLPPVSDFNFKPMAPAYPKEVRLQHGLVWTIVTLVMVIPSIVVAKPLAVKTALIGLPLLGLLMGLGFTALAVKSARVKGWTLREYDIAYRSGIWWRKIVVLPFDRVQHAEISSGPLQRKFGLASLKFFTAGGASIDLRMDGLREEDARDLREFIMGRASEAQNGNGLAAEFPEDPPAESKGAPVTPHEA